MSKKKIFSLIGLLVFVLIFFVSQKAYAPEAPIVAEQFTEAEVISVIDGDTVLVVFDDNKVRSGDSVRLLGVDAPELEFDDNDRNTKRECYAEESKKALEKMVLAKTVRLEPDPLNKDTDEYGRLLRYIYLENDTLVNQKLIEEGATRHLSWFEIEKNEEFAKTENTARSQGLGLWAVCPR